jgi:hypothetical protein
MDTTLEILTTTDQAFELPTPGQMAKDLAPYSDIENGLRASRPTKLSGMHQFVWRMARFHSGQDASMPVTAFWWLQDWIDEQMLDASVSGISDDAGKELTQILDDLADDVLRIYGLDPNGGARRWARAGLA